ncbi:MAG: hypothetical protein KKC76_15185 [Proteobacteria bacterium]|nr:hypothetical protein [Pseudomonadota bacterium]MBU4296146.1 hypothetical protein [Pseudomonadota bacterium]
MLSTDYQEKLVQAARKHRVPFLKITSAQRLAIGGHSAEDAEQIWRELGQWRRAAPHRRHHCRKSQR